MIRWVVLFALGILQASVVLSLGKPSRSDSDAIQILLNHAQELEFEIGTQVKDIKAERNPEKKQAMESKLDGIKRERIDAYNRAIWLTIIAYDIYPGCRYSLASGVDVARNVKQGQTVEWVPYFSDHKPVVMIGPTGLPLAQIPSLMKNAAGLTASDGTSRIYPEAFGDPPNPGELAAALVHEKTHFDINTARGRGDVLNHPEVEAAAYQAQLDAIKAGIIGLIRNAPRDIKHFWTTVWISTPPRVRMNGGAWRAIPVSS